MSAAALQRDVDAVGSTGERGVPNERGRFSACRVISGFPDENAHERLPPNERLPSQEEFEHDAPPNGEVLLLYVRDILRERRIAEQRDMNRVRWESIAIANGAYPTERLAAAPVGRDVQGWRQLERAAVVAEADHVNAKIHVDSVAGKPSHTMIRGYQANVCFCCERSY